MADLDKKENPGIPPAPAPPRRGANPWRLSESASKQAQRQDSTGPELFADLMKKAPTDDAHAEAQEPPQSVATRARPGLMPLIIVGAVFIIAMRVLFEARGGVGWARFIGPLLLIAFVVHGWWRVRQRRDTKKTTLG